ncbi:MAG: hypothetical protein ACRECZ_01590, partial [Methylocella sp.]
AAPLALGIFRSLVDGRASGFAATTDNIEGGALQSRGIQEADMRDIIQGMKNGPRGQRRPSSSSSGGGRSQIMMAILGLLAYKALKGSGGQAAPTDPGNSPSPSPPPRRWL